MVCLSGTPPPRPAPDLFSKYLASLLLSSWKLLAGTELKVPQSWHSLAIFLCPRTCPHLSPMRRETLFPHKDSYALEQVTQSGYAVSMLGDFQDWTM